MILPESDAFKLLEKYGIPVVRWSFAKSLEEALIEIENMYFPLVIKADGVAARRASGCFRTVYEASGFAKTFAAVEKNSHKQKSNGIILQEFVRSDTQHVQELLLGIKKSGHLKLVIGAGGPLTREKDVCVGYLPMPKASLTDLFRKTMISRVIEKPDRILGLVEKLSKLVEFEHLKEVEINPLFVYDRIAAGGATVRI